MHEENESSELPLAKILSFYQLERGVAVEAAVGRDERRDQPLVR